MTFDMFKKKWLSEDSIVWAVLQFLIFVAITLSCVVWSGLFDWVAALCEVLEKLIAKATHISFSDAYRPDAHHPERLRWFAASVLCNQVTIAFVVIGIVQRLGNKVSVPGDVPLSWFLGVMFVGSLGALWWGIRIGEGAFITYFFAVVAFCYVGSDVVAIYAACRAAANSNGHVERICVAKRRYWAALRLDGPNFLFHLLAALLVIATELRDHPDFTAGMSAGGFLLINLIFVTMISSDPQKHSPGEAVNPSRAKDGAKR